MSPAGQPALSYCGPAAAPADLLARWNGDPALLALFALLCLATTRAAPTQRPRCWLLLALGAFLYLSPFCAWGASLFTVRVVHHLILALIAAPLLAQLVGPQINRLPGGATVWTVASTLAMWAWHAPALYDWAATHDGGYWLMQLTILGTATMFWDRVSQTSAPTAVAALLAAMVAMGALGAIITLSTLPLYAVHFATTAPWGLAPLDDQQLAGLLMWAPASAVYLAAALMRVRAMMSREARA